MLKQNWRLISRLERLGDFLIIIVSFFVAYYGRASLLYWNALLKWNLPFRDELAPIKDYFIVLVVALLGYSVALTVLGAYSSMRLKSTFFLLRVSVVSSLCVFFTLAAVLFLLRIDLSRSFVALFCVLVCLTLAAERFAVMRVLRFWRRRGRNFRNIIICGIGEQALRVARDIQHTPELGIRIRGFAYLARTSQDQGEASPEKLESFQRSLLSISFARVPRLINGLRPLLRVIEESAIDEVIFTDVVEVMPLVEEVVLACSEQGVRTTIVADLFSTGLVKSEISHFAGTPLIHFQTPPGDRWQLTFKRAIDLTVSALLLVMLSPLFGILALAVKLSSPGPVMFIQRRVGLNGRLFHLYKFRSMVADAARDLEKLRPMNEMRGPVFKMKNDPRVTKVGAFLRRYSLDELPQLWNVFIGDMSLVGPRPPVPGEVSLYERRSRRRLSMRPGITCTWQVSGRNEIKDFDSWVKLDLEYIDNWSLARDIALLLRTIPAVIFGTGAR